MPTQRARLPVGGPGTPGIRTDEAPGVATPDAPTVAPDAATASPAATLAATRPLLHRTFEALGHRDFRIFYLGQLISVTGTWMQTVAQGWLVLILTGSPLLLGVTQAARTLPILFLSLPAGIVADRMDRRMVILVADIFMLVLSATLAILTLTGNVTIEAILLIGAGLGVANAFEMPARQSLVVQLTGRKLLANAIALNSLLFNTARVVGPALAGLLVALAGPGIAFTVNAFTYIPILACLLLIAPRPVERATGRMGGAMLEIGRYLRDQPVVAMLLVLLAANTVFASGYLFLGPALARDLGQGAEGLGLILSAAGVGAVAAGLRMAALAGRRGLARVLLVAALILGGSLVLVAFSSYFIVTMVLMLAVGWGTVTYSATSNTVIQTIVPEILRGRVMSLYTVVMVGLMPISGLFLGFLADRLGTAAAMGIGGAIWGVAAVSAFAASARLRSL